MNIEADTWVAEKLISYLLKNNNYKQDALRTMHKKKMLRLRT